GTPILVYKNCSVIESEQAHYVLSLINSSASAPAVPDALANDIDSDDHPLLWSYNNGWNACRAAMLAQPVSSGYKLNSPANQDGWVACRERMPDSDETKPIAIYTGKCLGQGMFVATYDEDGFFDYWEGGEIIGVTHWMPLPPAPEGGNG
ncbi:DUF551 domain-containing protein, partial [Serratia sp. IR-2025]